jgi:hypothetical protein
MIEKENDMYIIYYFLAFRFFHKYWQRWIYWVVGMIPIALLTHLVSSATPEAIGSEITRKLIVLTFLRWLFLLFRSFHHWLFGRNKPEPKVEPASTEAFLFNDTPEDKPPKD